jgi:hypothetical protein
METKMPFDFIGTPRLEKLLKTRAILDTQTDSDQHGFATCLWHGMHKARIVRARPDKVHEVMRALDCSYETAYSLIGCAGIRTKRAMLDTLIATEERRREDAVVIKPAQRTRTRRVLELAPMLFLAFLP